MKIDPQKALIVILPALLFSVGCMSRKTIVKDTFLLDVVREDSASQKTSAGIVAVLPFSIAPAFEGRGVVLRIGENQYESDFYNEYFISPSQMIADQTRHWMSESGLFAQVLLPASSVPPTHVLEGHISKMFLDMRDSEKPRAELEVTFFLVELQKRNRVIQFRNTYAASHRLQNSSRRDYIAAQGQCLQDILGNLERDLASKL